MYVYQAWSNMRYYGDTFVKIFIHNFDLYKKKLPIKNRIEKQCKLYKAGNMFYILHYILCVRPLWSYDIFDLVQLPTYTIYIFCDTGRTCLASSGVYLNVAVCFPFSKLNSISNFQSKQKRSKKGLSVLLCQSTIHFQIYKHTHTLKYTRYVCTFHEIRAHTRACIFVFCTTLMKHYTKPLGKLTSLWRKYKTKTT